MEDDTPLMVYYAIKGREAKKGRQWKQPQRSENIYANSDVIIEVQRKRMIMVPVEFFKISIYDSDNKGTPLRGKITSRRTDDRLAVNDKMHHSNISLVVAGWTMKGLQGTGLYQALSFY